MEARATSVVAPHRKRIDFIMTERDRLAPHGVEMLTGGSVEEVEERYARAATVYQPFYSRASAQGVALPCIINVSGLAY